MLLPRRPRRRLSKLRRSPKIFIPIPSERQLVIPFRPLGLFLIAFLFATTVYFLLRSDIFQIKELQFRFEELAGGVKLANEALVRQRISEEVLGRSIVFLNVRGVEDKIKREFPTVRAIEVEKEFPDGLGISVSVRVPLAQVRVGEERVLLVDAEGLLFREASGEDLPIIDLGDSFSGALGEVVGGGEVRAYLETLSVVSDEGLEASSIILKPGVVELKLESGPTISLSIEKPVIDQVSLLAELLRRFEVAGRKPVAVDLRFTRPVVRF